MNRCNPNDMLLFAKTAELGGISAAARATGRPKATVSRAVARLETALNARLLERSSHKVALTESGHALLAHCQRVAEEVQEAEARVGEIQGSVAGLLKIAVPITFGRAQLSPLLPKLLIKHPLLQLEVHVTDRAFDPIDGSFDVVVLPGPLSDSSLAARELGRTAYGIYASPSYLATHAPLADPMDLVSHALIAPYQPPASSVWSLARGAARQDVPVWARLQSNDAAMRRDAALEGLGIALVPSSICLEALALGRLQQVLPEWTPVRSVPVYALWPSRRHMSPRLRAFLDFLDEEIPIERDASRGPTHQLLHRR